MPSVTSSISLSHTYIHTNMCVCLCVHVCECVCLHNSCVCVVTTLSLFLIFFTCISAVSLSFSLYHGLLRPHSHLAPIFCFVPALSPCVSILMCFCAPASQVAQGSILVALRFVFQPPTHSASLACVNCSVVHDSAVSLVNPSLCKAVFTQWCCH